MEIVNRPRSPIRGGLRCQLFIAAVIILGCCGLSMPVMAQTPAASQSTATPPKASAKATMPNTGLLPTPTELRHFVAAAFAVQKIGRQVRPELKQANNDQERIKLQRQAERKMKAAVRAHHLSVTRYQQIYEAMQTDPSVRKQVEELVQARRQAKKN